MGAITVERAEGLNSHIPEGPGTRSQQRLSPLGAKTSPQRAQSASRLGTVRGSPADWPRRQHRLPLLHAQTETLLSDEATPELAMYWTSAPPYIPSSASGGSSDITVDYLNSTTPLADMHIGLSSIHAAESAMIEASTTIVNQYEKTKALFLADKDWAYGQQAETLTSMPSVSGTGASFPGHKTSVSADPIQKQAKAFADGSDGNPGINEIQAEVLRSIANSMALLGEFIVCLNNAGQAYASADFASALPSGDITVLGWTNTGTT